jgi:hypothetical protein
MASKDRQSRRAKRTPHAGETGTDHQNTLSHLRLPRSKEIAAHVMAPTG